MKRATLTALMGFSVFFALLLSVLVAANFYFHRRGAELLRLGRPGRRALAGVLGAGLALMILGRLLRKTLPGSVIEPMGVVGSTFELGVLISAVLLGVVDLARGVAGLGGLLLRRFTARAATVTAPRERSEPAAAAEDSARVEEAPSSAPLPRRTFLAQAAAGSAFLVGGSTATYGALFGRRDYLIETVSVPVVGLPRTLDGFTVVQLSDLHLGVFVGEREMRAAEDLVRQARPDVIVLTGDLIDNDPAYAAHLSRLVRRLGPLAREGVVAIPGNHDYYAGIDSTLDALRAGGADVLRNRGRLIGDRGGSFALLGVDDTYARRLGGGPDLQRAIASVPPDHARVLLCHNPIFFPEAIGEVALQLSGHTHGGQVNLVVRPADWVLSHGYIAGLYEQGGSRLYVNRGFGTAGPPVRVGAPPEVSRIILTAA